MSRRACIAGSAALLLAVACRSTIDVRSEAQKLIEIDRAWATVAGAGKDIDSTVSFWTDEARVIQSGQPTLQGKAAIRAMVTSVFAIPGFHITWSPDSAVVSAAGDLAYTFGTNSVTMPDAKGKPVTEKGRYITVWRKGADGRWRCVMDYTNSDPAPTPT